MVTFVCSRCNASLKKAQVQYHSCNGSFACITCNKDFSKVTFKNHDRCLTEAEKYQGSDFKAKVNKGEARQENWNNSIIEFFGNYKTSDANLRNVIKQLKNKSNIPQKEKPFKNFIRNISQIPSVGETLWNVVLTFKTSIQAAKDIPIVNNIVVKINEDTLKNKDLNQKNVNENTVKNMDEHLIIKNQSFDLNIKKEKKRKNDCIDEAETKIKKTKVKNEENLSTNDDNEEKPKKKKKKTKQIKVDEPIKIADSVPIFKKKTKKSNAVNAINVDTIVNENNAEINDSNKMDESLILIKKKKKDKKNSRKVEEMNNLNSSLTEKKDKNKKRKAKKSIEVETEA